jgi:hypothetical protein
MEQQQNPTNHQNNSEGKQNNNSPIAPITGTSLAIILFALGAAILGWLIHDYIPLGERGKLFTESVFSLAIAIVVIIQAGIYFRQAKALDAQMKIAGDSLIIGNRSLVSVSVDSDRIEFRPICVYLENVGRVPAFEIDVAVEMIAFTDPKYGNYPDFRAAVCETIQESYGSLSLQPGNPWLFLSIDLRKHFSKNEITLMAQQSMPLGLRGYVTWQDDFKGQPRQRTNFSFDYKRRSVVFPVANTSETEEQWIPTDPRSWDEVVEQVRRDEEKTKSEA